MASSSELDDDIDMDPSIMEQVRQAVRRVSEIEDDRHEDLGIQQMSDFAHNQSLDRRRQQMRRELRDRVASLEAEVEVLEESVRGTEQAGDGKAGQARDRVASSQAEVEILEESVRGAEQAEGQCVRGLKRARVLEEQVGERPCVRGAERAREQCVWKAGQPRDQVEVLEESVRGAEGQCVRGLKRARMLEEQQVEEQPCVRGAKRAREQCVRKARQPRDQVVSLQAEVGMLEEQVGEQPCVRGAEQAEGQWVRRSEQAREEEGPETTRAENGGTTHQNLIKATDPAELEERRKRSQSQVRLNKALSELRFTSVNCEIKHEDEELLLKEYTHIGTVMDFHFKVVFTVSEEKCENCDPKRKPGLGTIVTLKVAVDPRAKAEMAPLLAAKGPGVLQDRDLVGFYQTYGRYCLLHREREETFEEAKSRFAGFAGVDVSEDGTRLHLHNHKDLVLSFSWALEVSPQGSVNRSINFREKTPADTPDEVRDALSSIPWLLESISTVYGHREGFLKLMSQFMTITDQPEH